MNDQPDKELLLAIDDYELYSFSQRKVLKALASVSISGLASVGTPYLTKATKLSRTAIWSALNQLEKDEFIYPALTPSERHDGYKIDESKLEQIIKIYRKKDLFLNTNLYTTLQLH